MKYETGLHEMNDHEEHSFDSTMKNILTYCYSLRSKTKDGGVPKATSW